MKINNEDPHLKNLLKIVGETQVNTSAISSNIGKFKLLRNLFSEIEELMAVDFEALDHVRAKNKAKVNEERKQMRTELAEYIDKCDSYELSRLYDEYKRLKQK